MVAHVTVNAIIVCMYVYYVVYVIVACMYVQRERERESRGERQVKGDGGERYVRGTKEGRLVSRGERGREKRGGGDRCESLDRNRSITTLYRKRTIVSRFFPHFPQTFNKIRCHGNLHR